MAECHVDMEIETTVSSSLATTGAGKSLKRVPPSEDVSSEKEVIYLNKPPSRKLANFSSSPPQSPAPASALLPNLPPSPTDPAPVQQSTSSSPSVVSSPRVKVYPDDALGAGPWVVFFRPKPKGKSINVIQVSKDLARLYSSVVEISKVRPNKLRVVVSDRKHANAIVIDERFSLEYRVYVPSHDVEISGVVTETGLTCEMIKEGVGKFKRLPLVGVKILDSRQLAKVSQEEGKTKFTPSDSFRVTFAGSALPDYVMVGKLRLPVRLFVPKPMTCQKCKSVGHTSDYCANKERCATCGEQHEGKSCSATEHKCPYCGGSPHELSVCETYKSRWEKQKRSLKERSKRTFADILKGASPRAQQQQPINTQNVFATLPVDEIEADTANGGTPFIFQGNPRRKNVTTPKVQGQAPPVIPPVSMPKKSSAADKQNQVPPGFRGNNSPSNGPALEGTSKTPTVPVFPSSSTSQSGFIKLSDLLDQIFKCFNVSDSIRTIVTAMLPVLKTILQQLMQTWPLLAMIISLDV
ncbi:uncharacterized protein LOC129763562 [Toxorhynchites rutilus septentrionalis]|uniref:uncharacterized protein LOC129763562 n=1 Tax=Toxorhynchites rutilus septentrionalis TaxID=329112 RepID=UPI002478583B|nr:uncharacterized protein LOC129763562 [Toxorhynchites rutilus septentrionalis]